MNAARFFRIFIPTCCALLLSSCVQYSNSSYNGVQPVSPIPPEDFDRTRDAIGRESSPTGMPIVDSLQPTLKWKSTDSNTTKYDLIVYRATMRAVKETLIPSGREPVYYVPGEEVYYREGIEGNSHRIEQPLLPAMIYVWSVRTRDGSNVGPWSTYSFHSHIIALGGSAKTGGNSLWWPFRTP
jgi:hypothetical protein